MNYNEAKLKQLTAVGTYRVYGHSVDFDQSDENARRKDWHPVCPCICVLQENCPCVSDWLWWLPKDGIVAEGTSDRKDENGDKLQFFDVRVESTILVESVQPVRAGALKGLGASPTPEQLRGLTAASDGFSAPGTLNFWIEVGLIVAGWALSKALDALWDSPTIGDLIEEWKKQHQTPRPR